MEITSVEQYISYYMATNVLKKSLGDGMEFEIVYQAILDQIKNQTGNEENENIISGNNIRLDSLEMTMVGDVIKTNNGPINVDLNELNKILAQNKNVSTITGSISSSNVNSEVSSTVGLEKIYETVDKYANKYNIDRNLILAVIKAESNFNSSATSSVGAQGLMQVMPSNLNAMGVTNGYDIEQNINAGTQLLKSYLNQFGGNIEMALMAYNGGPGTMQRRGVATASDLYKMPQETQNYVPKVLGFYRDFSS